MSGQKNDWLEPELRMAGAAVSRLPRSKSPAGLLGRTLDRVAQLKPARKTLLLLRPITHPLARMAAVVVLMTMTVPLTDLDTVDKVGRGFENNVVGPKVVDRVQQVLDGFLANSTS